MNKGLRTCASAVTSVEGPHSQIISLNIPTHERRDALLRCINSYHQNFRLYGHRPAFNILEDSGDPQKVAGTIDVLSTFMRQTGASISFGGLGEMADFTHRVARYWGGGEEIVGFAIGRDPLFAKLTHIGASRNALLMCNIGYGLLMVDDDTVCDSLELNRSKIVPHSQRDTNVGTDCIMFESHQEAVQSCRRSVADFLGEHQKLLGKHTSKTSFRVQKLLPGGDVGGSSGPLATNNPGRIRVTLNAVVGDCGWGFPLHQMLPRHALNRFIDDERKYHVACSCRTAFQGSTSVLVTESAPHMLGNSMALDFSEELPPFVPIGRGEDYLFSLVLETCYPRTRFGYLPIAIQHLPVEARRRFGLGEFVGRAGFIDLATAFSALISKWRNSLGVASEATMLDLGRYLENVASAEDATFEAILTDSLREKVMSLSKSLEAELESRGNRPDYWVRDITAFLSKLRTSSIRGDNAIPIDLSIVLGKERAKHATKTAVLRYGKLLTAWPEIVSSVRDLAKNELRPLRNLSTAQSLL
jgi:hypothetical protein